MINELRIGNYVLTGFMNPSPSGLQKCFNKCEVKSIGIEKVIVTEKIGRKGLEKHNYENLKPIPLTEECLLKFGFEEDGVWVHKIKNITHNRMIGIDLVNNHIFLSQFDTHNKFRDVFVVKCDYVHQLQNLYFALTNEELTFKH